MSLSPPQDLLLRPMGTRLQPPDTFPPSRESLGALKQWPVHSIGVGEDGSRTFTAAPEGNYEQSMSGKVTGHRLCSWGWLCTLLPHTSQAQRSFPQMYLYTSQLGQLLLSLPLIVDILGLGHTKHVFSTAPQPAPIIIFSRGSSVAGLVPLY